jgi:hypothetical protein
VNTVLDYRALCTIIKLDQTFCTHQSVNALHNNFLVTRRGFSLLSLPVASLHDTCTIPTWEHRI